MTRKSAVVTGASSGIGRAVAELLATDGWSLTLIARDAGRISLAAERCRSMGAPSVRELALDLVSPPDVGAFAAELRKDPPDLLVLNAGFGVHGAFESTPLSLERELIDLQVGSVVTLLKSVVPGMLSRNHGAIVAVASLYSFVPVPYQSVYAATKAFLLSLMEAVRVELSSTNVKVITVCPGSTHTEFRARSGIPERHSWSQLTAHEVATAILGAVHRGGPSVIVPGWINRLMLFGLRLLPPTVRPVVVSWGNRFRGVNRVHPAE